MLSHAFSLTTMSCCSSAHERKPGCAVSVMFLHDRRSPISLPSVVANDGKSYFAKGEDLDQAVFEAQLGAEPPSMTQVKTQS